MASNLQIWWQRPHPGQIVLLIETTPFRFLPSFVIDSASETSCQLIAGHPISRHALHPLHVSTSICEVVYLNFLFSRLWSMQGPFSVTITNASSLFSSSLIT